MATPPLEAVPDLAGRDLDYAVTLALGWEVGERPEHWKCSATFAFRMPDDALCPTCSVPHYCEWYEAEKVLRIMQEEEIALHPNALGGWVAYNEAGKNATDGTTHPPTFVGNSIAEAVLRCFVASRLGPTVEATWRGVP